MLRELLTALGLVLFIEGVLVAAMPIRMRRLVEQMAAMDPATLRVLALVCAAVGCGVVWLARA